jgi:hypothetical protein
VKNASTSPAFAPPCCKPFTKVYACASSAGESGWRQVNGKAFMNESNAGNIAFRLDYEPGIRIGDFQDKPKVQKYHTESEFRSLFGPFFRSVKVDDFSNNINAACASARPVDPARLDRLDVLSLLGTQLTPPRRVHHMVLEKGIELVEGAQSLSEMSSTDDLPC